MPMVTKFVRVVTYHEELPFIISMAPQWSGLVRSRDKLNTFYLHLQKTHGYQTREGANLPLESQACKA